MILGQCNRSISVREIRLLYRHLPLLPIHDVARVRVVMAAGKKRDWAGAYFSPDLAFAARLTKRKDHISLNWNLAYCDFFL